MVPMRLPETDEIAAELYLVPPRRFVAARDALVRQARAAGHRELAREINGLRRPTLSAWLVNLLTRHEREAMQQLFAVGKELRHAQKQLDGDRLRHLANQRQELIAELLDRTRQHANEAGMRPTAAALAEVEATLLFGMVDPAGRYTVMSGHLTRPRTHTGFGPMPQVDPADAPPPPTPSDSAPAQDRQPASIPTQDRHPEWIPWPVDELARRRDQAAAGEPKHVAPARAEHVAGQNAQPATARTRHNGQQAEAEPAATPTRREAEEGLRRAEADLAATASRHWQVEHALADAEAAVETVQDRLEWLDQQRIEIRRERVTAEHHLAMARAAQHDALRALADARRAVEAAERRLQRTQEPPTRHERD
jgi:hypothetical protein